MARVGVDIDGVLYPFDEELKKALLRNGKRFYEHELPPPTKWEFYDEWNMTRECFVDYCNEYTNTGQLFRHGDPYPGAVAQVRRLAEAGHHVILITNRNFGDAGVVRGATQVWLHNHKVPYFELHFVKDKTEIEVDYHIDDNVDNHIAMRRAGVRSFLLNQKWNADTYCVYRTRSLEKYVDHILERESAPCSGLTAPTWDETRPRPYDPDAATTGEVRARLDKIVKENAGVLSRLSDEDPQESVADYIVRSTAEVRVTSSTGGQKGKKLARFSLLPARALWQVAEHYGKGAEKYDDHNWRKGYDWSLSIDALDRHFNSFKQGEDIDAETGSPHLAGVVFHALALLTFMDEQRGFDDRFNSTPSG